MIEYFDPRKDVQTKEIGRMTNNEKNHLQNLAKKIAEYAYSPQQEMKKILWKKHNSLKGERPMVLAFPEGAWSELIPYKTMTISDPFWRCQEWYLTRLIYRGKHIRDDNIIEPVLEMPIAYTYTGWGVDVRALSVEMDRGAVRYEPGINSLSDANELKYPAVEFLDAVNKRNLEALEEVFGNILPVRINNHIFIDTCLIGSLSRMRGIENLMFDMVENAEWLHSILRFMQNGIMNLMNVLEESSRLSLNNANDYVGSGGIGYSDELPSENFDGKKVSYCDMWGFADSQDFDIISPEMYEEFAVQYQIPLLKRYGLNSYGCCESLNKKIDIIKKIPQLRRVSISPWTNPSIAAEALGEKYILSWKPNPAQLVSNFDPAMIKNEINNVIDITKGCIVEMILKDTHTVNNHPERIETWVDSAMTLVQEGYR